MKKYYRKNKNANTPSLFFFSFLEHPFTGAEVVVKTRFFPPFWQFPLEIIKFEFRVCPAKFISVARGTNGNNNQFSVMMLKECEPISDKMLSRRRL